jgi:hypothetical protein
LCQILNPVNQLAFFDFFIYVEDGFASSESIPGFGFIAQWERQLAAFGRRFSRL